MSAIAGGLGGIVVSPDANLSSGFLLSFGANAISSTTADRYLYPCYVDALAPLNPIQWKAPFALRIDNLYVLHNIPGGNGEQVVYTLRKNNSVQSLTVSLASTGSFASDLAHSVIVAQGDLIDVIVTKALSIGSTPNDIMATLRGIPL